ncbi:hypothetical protein BG004_001135, partial [Podila humilis]
MSQIPLHPQSSERSLSSDANDIKTNADFVPWNTPFIRPVLARPKRTAKKRKREDDNSSQTEDGGNTGPPPGYPWMGHRRYSKMSSVPRMLTQELKDFVEFMSPTPEERKVREYVHWRVQTSVAKIWSDVQAVVFGSFDTQLYLPS